MEASTRVTRKLNKTFVWKASGLPSVFFTIVLWPTIEHLTFVITRRLWLVHVKWGRVNVPREGSPPHPQSVSGEWQSLNVSTGSTLGLALNQGVGCRLVQGGLSHPVGWGMWASSFELLVGWFHFWGVFFWGWMVRGWMVRGWGVRGSPGRRETGHPHRPLTCVSPFGLL